MAASISVSPTSFPRFATRTRRPPSTWLGKAFGFEKKFVVPGENNTVMHAELRLGSGMIMMGSAGKPDPKNPWSTEPFGIYVMVKEIDAHYARAKAAGAEIVRPIADTDYGAREYSVRDCDGHLWSFGTYDPYAES